LKYKEKQPLSQFNYMAPQARVKKN